MEDTEGWSIVGSRRKPRPIVTEPDKIQEACWFYNNGGCVRKDRTPKPDEECKYLHILSPDSKKPSHLSANKPCDKLNLYGMCKWKDSCKYSHRKLTEEEHHRYYGNFPPVHQESPPATPVVAPVSLPPKDSQLARLVSRIEDLESRVSLLSFQLRASDSRFDNRLTLLRNTVVERLAVISAAIELKTCEK